MNYWKWKWSNVIEQQYHFIFETHVLDNETTLCSSVLLQKLWRNGMVSWQNKWKYFSYYAKKYIFWTWQIHHLWNIVQRNQDRWFLDKLFGFFQKREYFPVLNPDGSTLWNACVSGQDKFFWIMFSLRVDLDLRFWSNPKVIL